MVKFGRRKEVNIMFPMNREAAIKHSLEFAKILCESQDLKVPLNEDGANAIADFIETLEIRFTQNTEKSD